MVRFLHIDCMVISLNEPFAKLSLRVKSCTPVIPGVRITRFGCIEKKDLDTGRYVKSFSVSQCLPLTSGLLRCGLDGPRL